MILAKFSDLMSHSEFWKFKPQNSPKWKGKFLGHFEVWMHIKSRGPISVTAVLGHFEVYLVIVQFNCNWIPEFNLKKDEICFINTTENFEFTFSNSIRNGNKSCLIPTFNNENNEFNDHQIEIDISECFEKICVMNLPKLSKHQIILTGTAFQCVESSHTGIVIRSKLQTIANGLRR